MDYSHLYDLVKNYKFAKVNASLRNGSFRQQNLSNNVGMVKLFRQGSPIVEGNKMKKNNSEIYNECKRLYPEFKFSGVMLNKNFECEPHKDKGNEGMVKIIGLGEYEGGELVVEGIEHDIKHKEANFEASTKEHYVKKFNGDRYSVVLFQHKGKK